MSTKGNISKFYFDRKFNFLFIIVFLCFLIISIFLISSGINITLKERNQIQDFFESENIVKTKEIIPTRDGSHIAAHIYMNKSLMSLEDRSIPTIIFIAGANNGKTHRIEQKIQLLRHGFAIVAMDQRGHHESGGYFTFYGKEIYDVSDVIDFLYTNYMQLNSTHIGLIGMSLGGGAALGAQAIDDRIYASAIYHPLSNLTDYFNAIGIDLIKIVGYTPGIKYTPDDINLPNWDEKLKETWVNRSTINLVTAENTHNLLLLHGTEDGEVRPINSERIVNKIDPLNNRDDIQLILREGLGHGENEKNDTSLKYVITWFTYFFRNTSINISNLENQIQFVHLDKVDYPHGGNYNIPYTIATIFVALLMFTSFIYIKLLKTLDGNKHTEQNKEENLSTEILSNKENFSTKNEKKRAINRSLLLILSYLISSLYCRYFNPSIFYGVLVYSNIIGIPLLLFFDKKISETRKEMHDLFKKQVLVDFFLKSIIFLVPIIFYFLIINYSANLTNNDVKVPEFIVGIRYVLMFSLPFLTPILFMRNLSLKYISFFFLSIFLAIFLFLLIIPLPEIQIIQIPALNLVLSLIFAVVFSLIYIFEKILNGLIFRNNLVLVLMISLIISILLWSRMMRLF